MRLLLLKGLACIILAIFLAGCSGPITDEDIASVDISLSEQQKLVLMFEKQVECEAHSPCFYATVDGALQSNSGRAQKLCREALDDIRLVAVPEELPVKVRKKLEEAKKLLIKDIEKMLAQADAAVNSSPGGFSLGKPSTCDAYSIIQEINIAYGIDKMMRGQYINCDVLASG